MASSRLILLTNDDGVDAPGIAALRIATAGLEPIQVMAPLFPQSGCGHVVTTGRPIGIVEHGERILAVEGTPADCVRLALHRFGTEIDWVLSGINAGGNLGADLNHSGTVAAVREAALHGIAGVAISHYIARGRTIDWDRAARWTVSILAELMAKPPGAGFFWNVNLPHPEPEAGDPERVYCPVDPSPLPVSYRQMRDGLVYSGDYQARPRLPGRDVEICFGGRIAISRVAAIDSSEP